MPKRLDLPPENNALLELVAGDEVELYGPALTMRDAALKRLEALVLEGKTPPFDVAGQLVFHAGPAPAGAGRPTAAIGPTTSARMDRFLGLLFEQGCRVTLGKGPRTEEARELHERYGSVYLAAVGGLGALYGGMVEEIEPVAWEELGAEAVFRVVVKGLPAIVAIDAKGNDFLAAQYGVHRQRTT
ncbi:MAG: FumA C-terminus/TtdB family hydratase beta subunit [Candidatus Geothermincolia bacterium]